MNKDVLFSSKSSEWTTPWAFVRHVERFLGLKFVLDVAATAENARAPEFYSMRQNGLHQSWRRNNGDVFCNPPYGRGRIEAWCEKGYQEATLNDGTIIVLLLPARTDTKYFHRYCVKGCVLLLKGRIHFGGTGVTDAAPFPSMLVVFNKLPPAIYAVEFPTEAMQ